MKLKNKQKTLQESMCVNCWQSLVADIFQRDISLIEKLEKYLKYIFKFIETDVIEVIAADVIRRVQKTLDTFACVSFELVNGYKMPLGLLSYAKMIGRNMVINYLNTPKVKMMKKIVGHQITSTNKENEDTNDFEKWVNEIEDVDQPLADEIIEREEKNELIRATINQVKDELTNRNKELKQKIIDLYVSGKMKNRMIFAELSKENALGANCIKGDALNHLIINTAFQFKQSFKEKISLLLEI
jgi:hypothetical protein